MERKGVNYLVLGVVGLMMVLVVGKVSPLQAQSCDGPIYCATNCGCTTQCTCTLQDCRSCESWLPFQCYNPGAIANDSLRATCTFAHLDNPHSPCAGTGFSLERKSGTWCNTTTTSFSCPAVYNPCCLEACSGGTPPPPPPEPDPGSCTVTLSESAGNLYVGGSTKDLTAAVSVNSMTTDRVEFSVISGPVTLSPGTDSTSPYITTVTAGAISGTAVVRAGVYESAGGAVCTDDITLTVYDNPTYTVFGTVYLDETGCSDTSTPTRPGDTSTVNESTVLGSTPVNADATYAYTGVEDGSYTITLNPSDVNYSCAACGCSKPINVSGGNVIQDFFVSTQRAAWWQTVGGDVGAEKMFLIAASA